MLIGLSCVKGKTALLCVYVRVYVVMKVTDHIVKSPACCRLFVCVFMVL